MYPILILRSEFICLVILVFLLFISRIYKIDQNSKSFKRVLFFSITHVIFDMITVLTVNNINNVPNWLNWFSHVLFYISAIMFSSEISNYVFEICYPRYAKKLYAIQHIITTVYICCLSFLRIDYVADVGTYSSAGPAAIAGYGVAFLFFFTALIILLTHLKQIPIPVKGALIPMMIVLMFTEISQIIWRSVLFTGGAVTIATVGLFFSLENPVEVFRKKALFDALTGVQSRSSFEEDIEKYDKQFIEKPNEDYSFVFCDLNDLRNVNNRFGHNEGDNYISLIASKIKECMKHSKSIYRIGGDEFLILYHNVEEDTVINEIKTLCEKCSEASKDLKYVAAISSGYARSSSSYKSLRDVIKTADYSMYQNKAKMKSGIKLEDSFNTKLNYVGLTDSLFDAMCASNNNTYPFITNMDTNVTRISPSWKEYFGLEDEFFNDFLSMWKERIHPDYFEGYMNDVVATINGHQKYHSYDYLAKKKDGDYVMVSCHGSIYSDTNSGTTYFTGYIVNHGLDENTDSLTGLKNFDVLTSKIAKYFEKDKPFALLKLKIRNLARINMLYGYSIGNEVLKDISEKLQEYTRGIGEVYCQSATNFTIIFDDNSEALVKECYKKISSILLAGLQTSAGIIPVTISGGAYISDNEKIPFDQIRSGLVFAVDESANNQRNELVFYRDENKKALNSDITLLAEVHGASIINKDKFLLRYQPIIDIKTNKPIGAEGLLRFLYPPHGEIAPDKYINFIENDPSYYRLGLRILEQAIMDGKMIQEKIADFKINVNITALQLQSEYFIDDMVKIIEKYNFNPKDLVLELTERCKQLESEFLFKKIAELRSMGIKIAIDDLGTGYSTMSLLMDMPVDEIKLDKDLVNKIPENENYQLFVKAIAEGCNIGSNKYTICFEGVESKQMLDMVKQFGDFYGQGYYFAKPLLMNELIEYIDSQK